MGSEMCIRDSPLAIIKLLSNTPSGPSAAVPDDDVCAALSVLSQVTVPPTVITTVLGMKHESVSSHPGVDDPGAFVTVAAIPPLACSANADGATAISEKIASNENDKHTDFFILRFFSKMPIF